MNRKTLLALALAGAFSLPHAVVYAQSDEKQPPQPAPELIAV